MSTELKKAIDGLAEQSGLPDGVEFDVVLPQELDEIVKGAVAGELAEVKEAMTLLIKAATSMKNEISDLRKDNEALTKSLVPISEAADLIKGNAVGDFAQKRAEPATQSGTVETTPADVINKGATPVADPREADRKVGELTVEQSCELPTLMEKARTIRDTERRNVDGFKEIVPSYEKGTVTAEQFEALKKGLSLASA